MSIMFEGLILPICLHLNALILLSISSTEPFNHGEFIFAICMCIFPVIGTKILYMLRLSVCSNDPTSVITDSSLSANSFLEHFLAELRCFEFVKRRF